MKTKLIMSLAGLLIVMGVGAQTPEFTDLLQQARDGDDFAQFFVGKSFLDGDGVPCNLDEGIRWLNVSAEQGNDKAQTELASAYLYPLRYPAGAFVCDREKSFELFSRAAELGNSQAMFGLGICYKHGWGVVPDAQKAFDFYKRAAENGDALAQCVVGDYFADGEDGVVEQNTKTAFEWYLKSAENGEEDAQTIVGDYYRQGRPGVVEQNIAIAIEWYLKAAEQGQVDAQRQIGMYYIFIAPRGNMKPKNKTIRENMKIGAHYLELAAKQGDVEAQHSLGLCYGLGLGVPMNQQISNSWHAKAARQGYQKSIEICRKLNINYQ